MSRRRVREQQEHARNQQRRTAFVVGGVIVGVLLVVGLMWVRGGARQAMDAAGDVGANPDLVAAAALRPCLSAGPSQSQAIGGLPSEPLPCLGTGSDFSLASLSGKPAIVNVWGSWCPPCREELPWFASLDADAADRLQIVGVDVTDTADSALSTLADLGVHYPSVFDPQGRTRVSLQWTGGTPVTLLVRADGSIAYRVEGRVPDEATLRSLVTEYLGVNMEQA